MDTSWSLGVLVGLPIFAVVILALVIGGAWAFHYRHDSYSGGEARALAITLWIVAALLVGICLSPLGYYPYSAEYHQWRLVSGQVTEVSKRLVPAGEKSMEEKVVIRIASGEYGCTDTRCTLVKKGDTVNLKCKRSWQYASVSGYDCRFVSRSES